MSDVPLGPPEPRVVLVADGAAAERYREKLSGPFEVTVEPSATDSLLAAEDVDVVLVDESNTTVQDRQFNHPDYQNNPVPMIGVLTDPPTLEEGPFHRVDQAIATPIDGPTLRERVTCLALRARYHRTLLELSRVVDRLVELETESMQTWEANEIDRTQLYNRRKRLEARSRELLEALADMGCLRSLYADLEAVSDGTPLIDHIELE